MRVRIVALAAVCGMLLAFAGQALAREKGEPKAKKPQNVVGTVAVTKAKDDKGVETIKSITISVTRRTENIVYNVVLDDNGKKVADFDGKKVKATGTVEEKDANKWLTVATCDLAPAKPPKKEGGVK